MPIAIDRWPPTAMNRSFSLVVLAAVLLVPAAARAQSLEDGGDAGAVDDAATAFDSGYGFAPVTPGPDAAAISATDGCDDKMLNAPCTLLGAAGFCFPSGVDGSDSDLECLVDSDTDTSGCNVAAAAAASASSAGTVFGLTVFFGLALAASRRVGRRRRK